MKKKRFVFLVFISAFVSFFFFVLIYNECIKPFEGYDYSILDSNNEKKYIDDEIYNFFKEHIDYKKYEEKFDIEFYYRYGKKSIFPNFNMLYNHYTNESYSLIIKFNDAYDKYKNDIISSYRFITTAVHFRPTIKFDSYQIDNWIFKEMYYNINMNFNEYMIAKYENNMRTKSYWFSYNDQKKEIVFSAMFHNNKIFSYSDTKEFEDFIKKNLYT